MLVIVTDGKLTRRHITSLGPHELISLLNEAEWRIYAPVNQPSLVQIIACRLDGAKPLSKPMLEFC